MTDLDITRLCAEAMGIPVRVKTAQFIGDDAGCFMTCIFGEPTYNPLYYDAQTLALVRRFGLNVLRQGESWTVMQKREGVGSADLNRAICEFVAKMQQAARNGK